MVAGEAATWVASTSAAKGDAQGLRAIEAELDRVAAQVWGLSAEELRAVQGHPGLFEGLRDYP